MENAKESGTTEIEETSPLLGESQSDTSGSIPTVKRQVPSVEIHLYRQGKGPIDVFKSNLCGWEEDQLDVRSILDKFSFKSIYAFNPESGRGVSIRFNPRNGRSILPYRDGSTIYVDGEPEDSLLKPITKIVLGVAVFTILIALVLKEPPAWVTNNIMKGNFPPWVLACMVIVFTRMRKRTRHFMSKLGW